MTETFAILTGASRGIGAALARGLLRSGTHLITIARHSDPELAEFAAEADAVLEQIEADLSNLEATERAARRMIEAMPRGASRYLLINNAAMLAPVVPAAQNTDAAAIAAALNLNVATPMLLCAHFLQAVEKLPADRRILNISSGAGRNATTGWGVYCGSKAALDMYSRVIHAEQGENGVRVASLAPGVVDTAMQAIIRATDPLNFPEVSRFREMHTSGKLVSPESVAARILNYLGRDDFGATDIDDIRKYN